MALLPIPACWDWWFDRIWTGVPKLTSSGPCSPTSVQPWKVPMPVPVAWPGVNGFTPDNAELAAAATAPAAARMSAAAASGLGMST